MMKRPCEAPSLLHYFFREQPHKAHPIYKVQKGPCEMARRDGRTEHEDTAGEESAAEETPDARTVWLGCKAASLLGASAARVASTLQSYSHLTYAFLNGAFFPSVLPLFSCRHMSCKPSAFSG